MKKCSLVLLLVLILLNCATVSFAQALKIITLMDGSILKGKVVQLDNGVYTIETSNLGSVNIPESNILSIASPDATKAQQAGSNSSQKAQLKNQVQAIQGNILIDPALMMELQDILQDEEIQSMLSDPALLDDVLSYDPERIQQNSNVQNLMQNKKMLELMEKIHQKIPAQK